MTGGATPIPRSLAMSYYADLDVSSIDELPPGRTPIKTLLINNNRRHEVIKFVREKANLGGQAYWVCPLIEESEKLELENAINTYNDLSSELQPIKVGLVHGKMKAKEKAEIMADFSANWTQVLVATTVIEVGVDVVSKYTGKVRVPSVILRKKMALSPKETTDEEAVWLVVSDALIL